jgi:hypothetical protein
MATTLARIQRCGGVLGVIGDGRLLNLFHPNLQNSGSPCL